MQNTKILLINKVCPFAERVWLTLQEKKIAYQLKQVSLDKKQTFFTETYRKAWGHDPNSDGKVPILIDDDKTIVESDLISWYLAEKYKSGMELIPDDAYDRLRMRWIIQENGKFIGLFYGFKGFKSKSTEEQQKHINSLNVTLHKMEQNLVLPYIMGQNFTLADILICPWLFRCCVFEKLFQLNILDKYQKIKEWMNNISQRESAKVTRQQDQFYVDGYKSYFD